MLTWQKEPHSRPTRVSNVLMAALTLLFCALPVLAEAGAEGSVRLDEANWKVADAIAHADNDGVRIAFSDKVFDRETLLADGVIGPFDLMGHNGNRLAITVDSDGPGMCLHYYTRTGNTQSSGSTCNSDYPKSITIDSYTDHLIAGSMRWGDPGGEHVHLRFDVPIVPGAIPAVASASDSDSEWESAPGEPLPADGGEPGKAVLAHYQALSTGDWELFKSIANPDWQQPQMEYLERAGEHLGWFALLRSSAVTNVEITGGTIDGEEAWVFLMGERHGYPAKLRARLEQFEGNWYFLYDEQ